MHEISPVLSGIYDKPDFIAQSGNLGLNPSKYSITDRPYTKFDHSSTNAGEASLSFSDVLDAINPLQHIPLVSALYRAATNQPINPVSRVAGDILYGAFAGPASALLGGLGAIGDTALNAQDKKGISETIVSALIPGPDQNPTLSVESKNISTPSTKVVSLPDPGGTNLPVEKTTNAPGASGGSLGAKSFPLVRNNLPYGGVLDPRNLTIPQNTVATMPLGAHALRLGSTIYTGKMMTGSHDIPAAPTNSFDGIASNVTSTNDKNSTSLTSNLDAVSYDLPKSLLDDISALKALNLYKSTAQLNSSRETLVPSQP